MISLLSSTTPAFHWNKWKFLYDLVKVRHVITPLLNIGVHVNPHPNLSSGKEVTEVTIFLTNKLKYLKREIPAP